MKAKSGGGGDSGRGSAKGKRAKPGGRAAPGADKILDTAERLFARNGYDAVSMNSIADVARTSKANIFHHFGSKRGLYIAVLRRNMGDCPHNGEVAACGGGFNEGIGGFARHHLERLFKHERMTRLIQRSLLDSGEKLGRDLAEKVFGDNFRKIVEAIAEGRAEGLMRKDADPAMAAIMIISANLFFFESREVFRHFPSVDFGDDMGRFSEKLTDILLNGILKPDASPKRAAKGPSQKRTGASKKRG